VLVKAITHASRTVLYRTRAELGLSVESARVCFCFSLSGHSLLPPKTQASVRIRVVIERTGRLVGRSSCLLSLSLSVSSLLALGEKTIADTTCGLLGRWLHKPPIRPLTDSTPTRPPRRKKRSGLTTISQVRFLITIFCSFSTIVPNFISHSFLPLLPFLSLSSDRLEFHHHGHLNCRFSVRPHNIPHARPVRPLHCDFSRNTTCATVRSNLRHDALPAKSDHRHSFCWIFIIIDRTFDFWYTKCRCFLISGSDKISSIS
jgi:hypothetical protein